MNAMVDLLAGLLAELGACPPLMTLCPQHGKPINITICSACLRDWAKVKAKGD
ncbi:MAG: hypothetical protein ACYTHM_11140 [Planctomycetota bacterium]